MIKIGGKEVRLSNLDKVLYPETGFTKGQMIEYYARIAPLMLPHLRDRPVSLKRFPDGINGEHFYQKNCPAHRPDWIQTAIITRESRASDTTVYCTANDQASLVWMANLAAIELHTQLFRMSDPTRPTMMVFDLDPGPGTDLLDCLQVARQLRETLASLKLESFIKTSGSKGAHLVVPLNTAVSFDATKTFARSLADLLARDDPKRITTNMSKSQRTGKVFVDWSQNDQHKTTVCVYSLRATTHPTVSTPISWDEAAGAIKRKDAAPLIFQADQVLKRIDRLGDLFEPLLKLKQRLPAIADAPPGPAPGRSSSKSRSASHRSARRR